MSTGDEDVKRDVKEVERKRRVRDERRLYDREGKDFDRRGGKRRRRKEQWAKSSDGYTIFVSGIQNEATEDDVMDEFSEFGDVVSISMPLDKRTGYVKVRIVLLDLV